MLERAKPGEIHVGMFDKAPPGSALNRRLHLWPVDGVAAGAAGAEATAVAGSDDHFVTAQFLAGGSIENLDLNALRTCCGLVCHVTLPRLQTKKNW
jgi:hypothetical protein